MDKNSMKLSLFNIVLCVISFYTHLRFLYYFITMLSICLILYNATVLCDDERKNKKASLFIFSLNFIVFLINHIYLK